MPRNRLPRVMIHYSPNGRRNHGRPLKRLLDTWDQNGSTSGPTPGKIYDGDEYYLVKSKENRASHYAVAFMSLLPSTSSSQMSSSDTLFSNTAGPPTSLIVRDQVSHPYRTADKTVMLSSPFIRYFVSNDAKCMKHLEYSLVLPFSHSKMPSDFVIID